MRSVQPEISLYLCHSVFCKGTIRCTAPSWALYETRSNCLVLLCLYSSEECIVCKLSESCRVGDCIVSRVPQSGTNNLRRAEMDYPWRLQCLGGRDFQHPVREILTTSDYINGRHCRRPSVESQQDNLRSATLPTPKSLNFPVYLSQLVTMKLATAIIPALAAVSVANPMPAEQGDVQPRQFGGVRVVPSTDIVIPTDLGE